MLINDFFDLTYLSTGSPVQKKGLLAITASGIMQTLKDHTPVVVGTLPLDLFTEKSDIDILCYFSNAEEFAEKIFFKLHNDIANFYIDRKFLSGIDSVIITFQIDEFDFEIVAQNVPVIQQLAFRHMTAEWDILSSRDAAFKQQILELKRDGLKTEPAFAKALGLDGDPYEALLR